MALSDYLTDEEISQYVYGDIDDDIEDLVTTDLNGIFCIPYQFMDTVDRRLEDSDIGRKYADKIVARLPLLFLAPGKQDFMGDFDDEDTESVTEELAEMAVSGTIGGSADSLVSGSGRYYTFLYDYDTYYTYVNAMAQSVAYFMGIGDEEISIGGHKKTKLRNFEWENATSSAFQSYFSSKENVVFYLNGLTEVSESFGNNTAESSLASTINGYSDTINEIKFLLGSDSVVGNLLEGATEITDTITSALSGVTATLGGGVLSSLTTSGVNDILTGGKIIFPQIWQDSTYDRSYSLDIKLRSPDNDPISIYLNIIIPYIHLLAMVLPRQIEDDVNGYSAPFLVKAYCKGMFNVDMGMITSMSVTKGGEQNWTDDAVPSQIDINITIDDLYSSLSMSGWKNSISDIVNNTAYVDFLANLAGLNLAQPEVARKTRYRLFLAGQKFRSIPSRIWNTFDRGITNLIYGLYQKI